ncbi:MAG: hypothetical protein P8X63_03310 [Desulfuromonadaceae bacterium]
MLDPSSLQVEPFATPMSIKPGSVPVLASFYPDLNGQVIHPRPDGKQVRYLSLPRRSLPGSRRRAAVKALVFPRFGSGDAAGLHRVQPDRALERLAASGSSDRGLERADVAAMITLVQQRPCYELVYDRLETALELLDNVLLKPAQPIETSYPSPFS